MAAVEAHRCRVLGSPWPGVHGTTIDSARHYGRHWHATHGVGLVEGGAQHSASGRGQVDAYAGDLITSNPGEVHDGRPLGGPSRRWRMLYFEPGVLASMAALDGAPFSGDAELTRPVIRDAALAQALRRLFERLDGWSASPRPDRVESLACEEALVRVTALLLARHANMKVPPLAAHADMRRVRDRLADERLDPPTLAELAAMAGLGRYQLLRRFERVYGVPPHAWLRLQRSERARGLICAGATLSAAATACGFADQSHMTRLFVRQFGYTPGAWQRAAARTAIRPQ